MRGILARRWTGRTEGGSRADLMPALLISLRLRDEAARFLWIAWRARNEGKGGPAGGTCSASAYELAERCACPAMAATLFALGPKREDPTLILFSGSALLSESEVYWRERGSVAWRSAWCTIGQALAVTSQKG